jgi:TPR repeat protein
MVSLPGLGVDKDPQEAFRWFRLAADQGHAQAQFMAGSVREKGFGVASGYAQAPHYFQMETGSHPEKNRDRH